MDKSFQTVDKPARIINLQSLLTKKEDSFFGTMIEKKPNSEDRNRMRIVRAFKRNLGTYSEIVNISELLGNKKHSLRRHLLFTLK